MNTVIIFTRLSGIHFKEASLNANNLVITLVIIFTLFSNVGKLPLIVKFCFFFVFCSTLRGQFKKERRTVCEKYDYNKHFMLFEESQYKILIFNAMKIKRQSIKKH